MKVLYSEGLASHADPESCARRPQGRTRSVDRGTHGQANELRNPIDRDADALLTVGRQHHLCRHREAQMGPAESMTPCTCGSLLRGSRESPRAVHGNGTVVRAENPKGAVPR